MIVPALGAGWRGSESLTRMMTTTWTIIEEAAEIDIIREIVIVIGIIPLLAIEIMLATAIMIDETEIMAAIATMAETETMIDIIVAVEIDREIGSILTMTAVVNIADLRLVHPHLIEGVAALLSVNRLAGLLRL